MKELWREHPITVPVIVTTLVILVVSLVGIFLFANGWNYPALEYSSLVFRCGLVVFVISAMGFTITDEFMSSSIKNAPILVKIGLVIFCGIIFAYIFV